MKKKKIIRGSLMATAFISGLVVAALILMNVSEPIVRQIEQEDEKEWVEVLSGPSPASMTSGDTTGIRGIYIYEHMDNPTGIYASNVTNNASMYAYQETNYNTSLGGNVPANTAFDIVIKVCIEHDDIENGTTHQNSWVRMNLTCPHTTPAIGALTAMTQQNITDQTKGADLNGFHHYYLNNGGSGYTIGNGVNVNVTAFKLELYQ